MKARRRLVVIITIVVGIVALAVFYRPLIAWFTGGDVTMGNAKSSTGMKADAGDLALTLALSPDPPRQEGNGLIVTVADKSGKPVEDADLNIEYLMPAMGGMQEMRGTAKIDERGDGEYRARFDLPMGGSWTLTTRVKSSHGNGEVQHSITIGKKGLSLLGASSGPASSSADTASARVQPLELSPQALGHVQEAMSALDEVRAKLAADTLDGVKASSERIVNMLREAAKLMTPEDAKLCLEDAAKAAGAVGSAKDLESARKAFAATTSHVTALAAADATLQQGWKIFECPMVEGFNKWLQRGEALENPYMGKKMLSCGSASTFTMPPPTSMPAHDHAAHGDGDPSEVEYFTCSMHPSVKQEQQGTCPICAMNLTPVTKGEIASGVVMVDDVRRQTIGVKTARVERRAMDATITTVGRVVFDEERLVDVTIKFGGFIEELFVDETGQKVAKGQPLFFLYSPELYAAQVEYLQALKTAKTLGGSGAGFSESLVRSAKRRLELWDLGEKQIEKLVERGEATDKMPIASPATGYVVEKNVVKGAKIEVGATVYRIAGLDEIWIEADVYESDLPKVKSGQRAMVTLPYLPGKDLEGKVTFIYPYLNEGTRTGRVRVELKNPGLDLKPEMFATVMLQASEGEALVVPESAVVYTGPRRLVFIDLGEGRLKPAQVRLGKKVGGFFEVLDGVKAGDIVVTSGNFLIAAESRLKGAAAYWAEEGGGASSQPSGAQSQPSGAESQPSGAESQPAMRGHDGHR